MLLIDISKNVWKVIIWLEEDIVIRKFQNIQKNITWLEEDKVRLEKSNICG